MTLPGLNALITRLSEVGIFQQLEGHEAHSDRRDAYLRALVAAHQRINLTQSVAAQRISMALCPRTDGNRDALGSALCALGFHPSAPRPRRLTGLDPVRPLPLPPLRRSRTCSPT